MKYPIDIQSVNRHLNKYSMAWAVLSALVYGIIIYLFGAYILCYRESIGTFYYHPMLLDGMFGGNADISALTGLWIQQFFHTPALATMSTAIILALTTLCNALTVNKIGNSRILSAIAMCPSMLVCIDMCSPEFNMSVLGMFFWVSLLLCLIAVIRNNFVRATFVLLLLLVVIDSGIQPFTCSPAPWVVFAAIMIIAFAVRRLSILRPRAKVAAVAAQCFAVAISGVVFGHDKIDTESNNVYGITVLTGKGDYDGVIALSDKVATNDIRVQNCLNLALAEKGTLASELFRRPCFGAESLLMNMTTPEAFTILADVYYSMGHLAASQCFAFQANEAYGNMSPRLLRLLTDLNIIYGNYETAAKYIDILSHTLMHRDWALKRKTLLHHPEAIAAHPELGKKLACIAFDDRFTAVNGIADDLLQVCRANPPHTSTIHYLGCFYILTANLPAFMQLMDECRAQETLPMPLPRHFQEAVCTAALASGQNVDEAYGISTQMMEACCDFWRNGAAAPATCWQYLKTARRSHGAVR